MCSLLEGRVAVDAEWLANGPWSGEKERTRSDGSLLCKHTPMCIHKAFFGDNDRTAVNAFS